MMGVLQEQWIRLISIAYCKVGEGWSIIRLITTWGEVVVVASNAKFRPDLFLWDSQDKLSRLFPFPSPQSLVI